MSVEMRAYAKINLTLEVLGPRPDGYHQVMTIMQTIDLWDRVRAVLGPGIELRCSRIELEGQDNLAWKAAHRLQQYSGSMAGAHIYLDKGIPVAMGLGGGSSDAAATLLVLNQLWDLHLEDNALMSIAAGLGSDVPFFLKGGTVLAQGRGEEIQSLPPLPPHPVLLLCPPLSMASKTARLYGMLHPGSYSDGSITRRVVQGLDWGHLASDELYNVFEQVAPLAFKDLYETAGAAMLNAGVPNLHLCGSGPALFSILDSQKQGEEAQEVLKQAGWQSYLVNTIASTNKE